MSEQNRDRPSEPDYAKQKLNRGFFGVGSFHGQILLFIPLPIYEKIGKERILTLAKKIYSKKHLSNFKGVSTLYQKSFMLELPPNPDLLRSFVVVLCCAME